MTKLSPETLGIVKGVRVLISDESKWTQHWFARDKDGRACNAENEKAVCWCVAGAFKKVSGQDFASIEFKKFARLFPNSAISNWNDSQPGYNAVAKRLDEIIRENS